MESPNGVHASSPRGRRLPSVTSPGNHSCTRTLLSETVTCVLHIWKLACTDASGSEWQLEVFTTLAGLAGHHLCTLPGDSLRHGAGPDCLFGSVRQYSFEFASSGGLERERLAGESAPASRGYLSVFRRCVGNLQPHVFSASLFSISNSEMISVRSSDWSNSSRTRTRAVRTESSGTFRCLQIGPIEVIRSS